MVSYLDMFRLLTVNRLQKLSSDNPGDVSMSAVSSVGVSEKKVG